MKKLLLLLVVVVSAGAATAQSKIAHVNSQMLLDTMPSRQMAIQKFAEYEKAIYVELQEMEADLQKAYLAYQEKSQSGTMSPVLMKAEEDKIRRKEQAFQERQQSAQGDLQNYSDELNAPILKKVQDAVKKVAANKKLDYVIDVSTTLVANGEDITNEVAAELLKIDAAAATPEN